MLRPSLVPSLLICRKANQDVGNTNAQLYEHASVWWASDQEVIEKSHLAMLRDAADVQEALRDLRGSIEELAERLLGAQRVSFTPTDAEGYSHAAKISCDAMDLGVMGMVDAKRLL